MAKTMRAAAMMGGIAGGVFVAARAKSSVRQQPRPHVATIDRPFDETSHINDLPGRLGELRDRIDLRMSPAPGDRGTEISVRHKASDSSANSTGEFDRELREALRETKSLLEAGEFVQPDRENTTQRTIMGLPIDLASSLGRKEGRL